MNTRTGYVVFGHGSSIESANAMVRRVAADLARVGGYRVEAAFLELAQPDLMAAVGVLAREGMARVVVIPYFLTLGVHLQRDLPRIAAEAASIQKDVSIEITPPLDGHPALVRVLLDRVAEAKTAVV
jgi:sirohydrochlorin ferrochelatase